MDTDSVPPESSVRLLKKFFGHSSFRPLQWTVDQVVVMSTGYGKSVCYQLPSLLTGKLTIVISPLISLMNDQVNTARNSGIEAACLNGETSLNEQQSVLASDNLRLLYTTPEFVLRSGSLLKHIRETHCVSEWGHEFRPSYRQLAEVRNLFGKNVAVMALTATATEHVRLDIVTSLEMHQPIITLASLDRPNLYLSVRFPTSLEGLLQLLISNEKKKGVQCARYHARMSLVARRKAHECFMNGRTTTFIATVAFAPKNMESYYQEIGRAGRDGHPGKCVIFYKDQELAKHRYRMLREQGLREGYKKHLLEMLSLMERFLHATSCRRFMLLSYFDERVKKEVPNIRCCDICDELIRCKNNAIDRSLTNSRNYGNEAVILLRAMDIFAGCTGLGKVIDFVKGKENVAQAKQKNRYYGSGKHKTEVFWKELGRILRMNGYITETKSFHNDFAHLVSLSDKGKNWLYGKNRELFLVPTPLLSGQIQVNEEHCISQNKPLCSKTLNLTKQREWKDYKCYVEVLHPGNIAASLSEVIKKGMVTLNEACTDVYRKHIIKKLSLGDLAEILGVSEGTVASYFVSFVKNGLPIDLDPVGINRQHIDIVYNIIRKHGSDISRLKPIMEALPEDFIDYNRLKIVSAILEYEYGVEDNLEEASCSAVPTDNSNKRNVPEWMKMPIHLMQNKRRKKSGLLT